jgi:hypothetical protein
MDERVRPDGWLLGGPVERVAVSLRVLGDEVDPVEITRLFGLEPRFAARKGDLVQRGGRVVSQRTGIWSFALTEAPSPEWELDDAITALLARFPSDLALWAELGHRFRLDVFCGLMLGTANQGTALRPPTLLALAERGLTLDVDIYGPLSRTEAT